MKVVIYSREAIKELMKGEFPKNTAVISFCSPRKTRRAEEVRVYFGNVCDRVFNILIPDIDIEILGDCGYTYETYLAEEDELAKFIYEVRAEGRDIICQCDFGQSRSAACAAAILQHFEGRGIDIFSDYRYYPNQLVYHKVFDALERVTSRTVKIKDRIWCKLRASSNKCSYTFFPSDIPNECGGIPDADLIEGSIVCESRESAKQCLQSIASLIENGYGEILNWWIALDMGDIMTHIFNGAPMQYLHRTIDALQVNDLVKHLKGAKIIFAYFNMPNGSKSSAHYEDLLEQISAKSLADTSVWTQASFGTMDFCEIDVWYR